jgi:dethiobiotin synthetase/adenosylmethionine--8-amino-7-oxononanoate aminotransferase
MPLLFPNLRVTQVFGGEHEPLSFGEISADQARNHIANTDVGKTLLTTALLRSTASKMLAGVGGGADGSDKKRLFYLKPVSTGPDDESDVR